MDAETMKHIFEPFFSTRSPAPEPDWDWRSATASSSSCAAASSPRVRASRGAEFHARAAPLSVSGALAHRPPAWSCRAAPRPCSWSKTIRRCAKPRCGCCGPRGYTVYEAADGAAALTLVEKLGETRIDLLFTDVVLPQMRGQELAQCLMGGGRI